MIDDDYYVNASHQGIGYTLRARLDQATEDNINSGIPNGEAERLALRETIDPQISFQRRIGQEWYKGKE